MLSTKFSFQHPGAEHLFLIHRLGSGSEWHSFPRWNLHLPSQQKPLISRCTILIGRHLSARQSLHFLNLLQCPIHDLDDGVQSHAAAMHHERLGIDSLRRIRYHLVGIIASSRRMHPSVLNQTLVRSFRMCQHAVCVKHSCSLRLLWCIYWFLCFFFNSVRQSRKMSLLPAHLSSLVHYYWSGCFRP